MPRTFFRTVVLAAVGLLACYRGVVAQPKAGQPWIVPNLGMEFVPVAPGTYRMGSSERTDEEPVHTVQISREFWLGKHEVTQAEYERVVGSNPSHSRGSWNPVERVSWDDAVAFCRALTARERAAGRLPAGYSYRLPTEAEWEYAARGGSKSRGFVYSGSDSVVDVAWHVGNSKRSTQAVGAKVVNELGLHDMSGKVSEWCLDWYDDDYYRKSPMRDPRGPV